MSINPVTLAGFTGKDARSSSTHNGKSMTKLSVATTKRYKDARQFPLSSPSEN
jgi:single-stranded DNA-binding protein